MYYSTFTSSRFSTDWQSKLDAYRGHIPDWLLERIDERYSPCLSRERALCHPITAFITNYICTLIKRAHNNANNTSDILYIIYIKTNQCWALLGPMPCTMFYALLLLAGVMFMQYAAFPQVQ